MSQFDKSRQINMVSAFRVLANERMQLTWLIGAPIHGSFGSPTCLRVGRPRFTRHAADASR